MACFLTAASRNKHFAVQLFQILGWLNSDSRLANSEFSQLRLPWACTLHVFKNQWFTKKFSQIISKLMSIGKVANTFPSGLEEYGHL